MKKHWRPSRSDLSRHGAPGKIRFLRRPVRLMHIHKMGGQYADWMEQSSSSFAHRRGNLCDWELVILASPYRIRPRLCISSSKRTCHCRVLVHQATPARASCHNYLVHAYVSVPCSIAPCVVRWDFLNKILNNGSSTGTAGIMLPELIAIKRSKCRGAVVPHGENWAPSTVVNADLPTDPSTGYHVKNWMPSTDPGIVVLKSPG